MTTTTVAAAAIARTVVSCERRAHEVAIEDANGEDADTRRECCEWRHVLTTILMGGFDRRRFHASRIKALHLQAREATTTCDKQQVINVYHSHDFRFSAFECDQNRRQNRADWRRPKEAPANEPLFIDRRHSGRCGGGESPAFFVDT